MIYANIASLQDREKELLITIESIYDEVDEINLYLNNYKSCPIIDKKINYILSDNSHGDSGKFFFCDKVKGYYFTMDDDLTYPTNYVKDTISRYNNNIVSYHGRSFNRFPIKSYYNENCNRYHCLSNVGHDVEVQFGATGIMMFNTDYFNVNFEDFEHKNMTDVYIGCFAKEKNIKITCLSHKNDYFKYHLDKSKWTIYDSHRKRDQIQTDLVNKYFNKK